VTTQSAAAKAELRARLRAARTRRPEIDRVNAGIALRDLVVDVPEVADASVVAAYYGIRGEPPTALLLTELRDRGKQVLLPIQTSDGDLDWAQFDGGETALGPHGIVEPSGPRLGLDAIATADVVVVPALAVDREGHRLGQGGGAYDRALRRSGDALIVAVVYLDELLDELPTEPHDISVHAIATPTNLIRCRD
jgi:5-formyltetrahydrofolate cyclo-ligase